MSSKAGPYEPLGTLAKSCCSNTAYRADQGFASDPGYEHVPAANRNDNNVNYIQDTNMRTALNYMLMASATLMVQARIGGAGGSQVGVRVGGRGGWHDKG